MAELVDSLQIYRGYQPEDAALITRYFRLDPTPEPGFVLDRLGVRTRMSSLWDGLDSLDGTVLPPPLPSDFHAEAIEWIGLLRSVAEARDQFAAMELGAGWGPWLVAAAAAARLNGIADTFLLGVEADPQHYVSLRQHFLDNGLEPNRHRLLHAAVGVASGTVRFPRVADPRNAWDARPMREGASADHLGRRFADFVEVEVLDLAALLAQRPVWDLVHIDVQGSEAELCRAALNALAARARRLVIGTHSRAIEGDLLMLLHRAGWRLENEKPCRFIFHADAPGLEAMTTHDGAQVWSNPALID
ncbi:MAG TPA: FkbM family methyltransferase [Acetobacteraceae bacterium]|nr:FkbM family methyltransferase [Acetobacteraceae bacterium]